MDEVEFSLWTSYLFIVGIIGTTICITVFIKILKQHDAVIGIIATLSKIMASFVYGLSPTKTWFYVGPIVDIFGGATSTAVKSLATKIVDEDEVGKICSITGEMEAIAPLIYTPLYSKLYAITLTSTPGAFYLVGGIMTMPALFAFIYLLHMHIKEQKDVVRNPAEKEMHAHENCITTL